MKAVSKILSTFAFVYIETLKPGSLRWDECQNAYKSLSLPIICPKSNASYFRGRMTSWLRLPTSNVFISTFIPIAPRSSLMRRAVFTNSGALLVEIEKARGVVVVLFLSVTLFSKNPSAFFFPACFCQARFNIFHHVDMRRPAQRRG